MIKDVIYSNRIEYNYIVCGSSKNEGIDFRAYGYCSFLSVGMLCCLICCILIDSHNEQAQIQAKKIALDLL